jgi:ABC-type Na+ efflux pump permease subunit
MEPEKKSNGALVGSIIIIIILIVGGIYIWQSKVQKALEEKKFQEENVVPLDTNELNTLEEDLNTTDTTIDVDVNAIN